MLRVSLNTEASEGAGEIFGVIFRTPHRGSAPEDVHGATLVGDGARGEPLAPG